MFTTYHLWVTDNWFRNPFLIPMDTLYAKLGYTVELQDLPTLKRTIAARKPVWKQRRSVISKRRNQKGQPYCHSSADNTLLLFHRATLGHRMWKEVSSLIMWAQRMTVWISSKLSWTHTLLATISSACIVSDAVIATNSNLAVEDRPSDETGYSKWKRIPRQMPDALNGCLCGIVVDSQSDGVLECKRLGCEI